MTENIIIEQLTALRRDVARLAGLAPTPEQIDALRRDLAEHRRVMQETPNQADRIDNSVRTLVGALRDFKDTVLPLLRRVTGAVLDAKRGSAPREDSDAV